MFWIGLGIAVAGLFVGLGISDIGGGIKAAAEIMKKK